MKFEKLSKVAVKETKRSEKAVSVSSRGMTTRSGLRAGFNGYLGVVAPPERFTAGPGSTGE